MRTGRAILALALLTMIAQPLMAQATRPADALPPPTWEIVDDGEVAERDDDIQCREWDRVRIANPQLRVPAYRGESEDDDPHVLTDEDGVPLLDELGNFIGCEGAAGAAWLSGPVPYLIGAAVIAQIVLFAGGSGDDAPDPRGDSPG